MSHLFLYYLIIGLIVSLLFLDSIFYDFFKDDFIFALISTIIIILIWPIILFSMVLVTILILATFYRGKR